MHLPVLGWLPLLFLAVLLLARLFLGGQRAGQSDSPEVRDEPRYWIGPFYNNPDDPRVFVPKRFGIGTTLNFGRPLGKVLLLGILLLAVLPLIVRALSHS